MKRGYYEKHPSGVWIVRSPNGLHGTLKKHKVVEHEDGTITVSPSILITIPGRDDLRYHGFLERGKWQTLSDTKGEL